MAHILGLAGDEFPDCPPFYVIEKNSFNRGWEDIRETNVLRMYLALTIIIARKIRARSKAKNQHITYNGCTVQGRIQMVKILKAIEKDNLSNCYNVGIYKNFNIFYWEKVLQLGSWRYSLLGRIQF